MDAPHQIEDHLNRTDIDDEGVSAMCVDLAEARFNREIRTVDMLANDSAFTIDSRYETLPTDFLEARRFELTRSPVVPLEYITVEELSRRRSETWTSSGVPCYYTVVDGQFEFLPTPNATFTGDLVYYKRITALDGSNATNWLLDAHPDIYLFACLVEAETYNRDDERALMWETRLQQAMRKLRIQDERARIGGTPRQRWPVLG